MIGLNRRRTMGKALPYDAEIEYLESDGTQYIDLPLSVEVNQYFAIEGEMIPLLKPTNGRDQYIFGSNPSNQFSASYYRMNGNHYVTYATTIGTDPANGAMGCGTTIGNKGNFYLGTDGKTMPTTGEFTSLPRMITQKITAFRLIKGYETYGCPICFGKIKITIGNNIKYDLLPVRVGQTGFMYDKVSGELFGNSGTGSFVLGNDK